jgi:hypothetical protein
MSTNDCTTPTIRQTHGRKRLCNLRVTKIDGELVLNPHGDGSCVLRLDEVAVTQLFNLPGEWLG